MFLLRFPNYVHYFLNWQCIMLVHTKLTAQLPEFFVLAGCVLQRAILATRKSQELKYDIRCDVQSQTSPYVYCYPVLFKNCYFEQPIYSLSFIEIFPTVSSKKVPNPSLLTSWRSASSSSVTTSCTSLGLQPTSRLKSSQHSSSSSDDPPWNLECPPFLLWGPLSLLPYKKQWWNSDQQIYALFSASIIIDWLSSYTYWAWVH